MNTETLNNFKSLLSVPSKSRQESRMVKYICDYLDGLEDQGMVISYHIDHMDNIYVTKGYGEQTYPCFVSHTDTVHAIDTINVMEGVSTKPTTFGKSFGNEEFEVLYGMNDEGQPTGIGGDDKCGVFICLELITRLDHCKAAFFVSEEIGCVGSSEADVHFFDDVSFVCQYDAPGDHLITEICSGVRLYEKGGEFIYNAKPLIEEAFGNPMIEQSHPFTDVMQLKNKLPITCINISCGYYNMHTASEFIVVDDVERAIEAGMKIAELGYDGKFYFENSTPDFYNDFESNVYEEESTWLSDESLMFDDEEGGITIEEYGTRNYVTLTDKETKKLYLILKEKYEDTNQLSLF